MNIESLKTLMDPPAKLHSNSVDWHMVESQLSISLPEDYKLYIDSYGAGWVNDYIFILTPTLGDDLYNLQKQSQIMLDRYRNFKIEFPEYYPHEAFPDVGGLFPFGYTEGGGHLYWKACGNPEDWAVVIYGSGGGRWEEYKLSMTEFLQKILKNEVNCKMLPADLTDDGVEFVIEG